MRNRRLSTALCALVLGGALGLFTGCDPTELDDGGGGGVPVTSTLSCSDESECVPNDCCGQGTAITHVDEGDAPRSCPVTCPPGSPSSGTVDNGRCIPVCRFDVVANANRCSAACSG